MKLTRLIGLVVMLLTSLHSTAHEYYTLTIKASAESGESLSGTPLHIEHILYGLIYTGAFDTNNSFTCTQLLAGDHQIRIEKEGLESYIDTITISQNSTLEIVMKEFVRTPYALHTETTYNPQDGMPTVNFSWNQERNYFFDDFERHEPFSINFAPWTGKDLDNAQAANLQGTYPNRGMFQYATIFNPLTITPPVWYTYPVLRPYSGAQCVGFVRTASGVANNDWLISPQITVGVKNVVRFMAKAGDAAPEKFKVYISATGTEISDFKPLTLTDFEEVDYKAWKTMEYNLSKYENKKVYIAIQCISKAAFLLMVDDFYLGPQTINPSRSKRLEKSLDNPYERFEVFANNSYLGTTEETNYTITNLAAGEHRLGVLSKYRVSMSDTTQTSVLIKSRSEFASLQVMVKSNGGDANGTIINFTNRSTGESWDDSVENYKSGFAFLPKGEYLIDIRDPKFTTVSQSINLTNDTVIAIELTEIITAPYNVRWDLTFDNTTTKSDVNLTWNKNYGWSEGFESYADFAQQFGGWLSYDLDKSAGYAISYNGSIVTFPGSTGSLPGIVFNAHATQPSMGSDAAMLAPEGSKCIVFFSPERAVADDWLIAPKQTISNDYVVRFWAKSYDGSYLESLKVLASTENSTTSFTLLDALTIPNEWTEYEIDLSAYEGQDIHIGFNYCSYDKFILSMDNIYIGPRVPVSESNIGVEQYNVYLGNTKIGETVDAAYTITQLPTGTYQVGIQAQYKSGNSPITYITVRTGSTDQSQTLDKPVVISSDEHSITLSNYGEHTLSYAVYDNLGRCLEQRTTSESSIQTKALPTGLYIVNVEAATQRQQQKVIIK